MNRNEFSQFFVGIGIMALIGGILGFFWDTYFGIGWLFVAGWVFAVALYLNWRNRRVRSILFYIGGMLVVALVAGYYAMIAVFLPDWLKPD